MAQPKRPTSEETKRVFEGNVVAIADELETSPDYFYAVLSGLKPDHYSNFRWIFRGIARRTPGKEQIYLADLNSIVRNIREGGTVTLDPMNFLVTDLGDACQKITDLWGKSLDRCLPTNQMTKALDEVIKKAQEIKWALELEADPRNSAVVAGRGR